MSVEVSNITCSLPSDADQAGIVTDLALCVLYKTLIAGFLIIIYHSSVNIVTAWRCLFATFSFPMMPHHYASADSALLCTGFANLRELLMPGLDALKEPAVQHTAAGAAEVDMSYNCSSLGVF